MLSCKRQNFHHSKMPKLGDIVTLPKNLGYGNRKFIVKSFPLCDNVRPFSIGIHTVNLEALDNRQEIRVSGFYCTD